MYFPEVYNPYVCYYRADPIYTYFADAKSFCNNLYSPLSSLIAIKDDTQLYYGKKFALYFGSSENIWVDL